MSARGGYSIVVIGGLAGKKLCARDGEMEDMPVCERKILATACVDDSESGHLVLVNAGDGPGHTRTVSGKEVGKEKGAAG